MNWSYLITEQAPRTPNGIAAPSTTIMVFAHGFDQDLQKRGRAYQEDPLNITQVAQRYLATLDQEYATVDISYTHIPYTDLKNRTYQPARIVYTFSSSTEPLLRFFQLTDDSAAASERQIDEVKNGVKLYLFLSMEFWNEIVQTWKLKLATEILLFSNGMYISLDTFNQALKLRVDNGDVEEEVSGYGNIKRTKAWKLLHNHDSDSQYNGIDFTCARMQYAAYSLRDITPRFTGDFFEEVHTGSEASDLTD